MTLFQDVAAIESAWLRHDTIHAESDYPLYERWGVILTHIPETRTASLSSDFSPVYQRVLSEGWSGERLLAAVDLTMIQTRWFCHLLSTLIGRSHWIRYNLEAVSVWRNRLIDHMDVSVPDGFEQVGGELTYIPAHTVEPVRHNWRH